MQATANAGEGVIVWDPAREARYYTVGWLNRADAKPLSDVGDELAAPIHLHHGPGSVASHVVKELDGGGDSAGAEQWLRGQTGNNRLRHVFHRATSSGSHRGESSGIALYMFPVRFWDRLFQGSPLHHRGTDN